MADLSVYKTIANIKPFEFNAPKMPTPFERLEDEQKIKGLVRENRLQGIMGKHWQAGTQNTEQYYKDLAGVGAFDQIEKSQKSEREKKTADLDAESKAYDTKTKQLEFMARITSPYLNKDPNDPVSQQSFIDDLDFAEKATGASFAQIRDSFKSGKLPDVYQKGMSALEQHKQQVKERDYQLEQQKFGYQKENDQRNFDLRQRSQAAGQRPYISPQSQGTGRPLPAQAIDKFTKAQTAHENAKQFESTFKDEYAGQPLTGGARNMYGNVMGDDSGQASWWKNYQANKNETRNALFGGALTPTEQAEYDKQDISPGMEPGEIRKRLTRQRELSERGYSRLTQNYAKGGFDTSGFTDQGEQPPDQAGQQPNSQGSQRPGYVPFGG